MKFGLMSGASMTGITVDWEQWCQVLPFAFRVVEPETIRLTRE